MDINILTEEQVAQLSHLISEANTILITCHKSPDGDAVGSSLGWAEYLRSLGKEAIVIVPDQYPDFLLWLPNTEKIVRYDKHKDLSRLQYAQPCRGNGAGSCLNPSPTSSHRPSSESRRTCGADSLTSGGLKHQ